MKTIYIDLDEEIADLIHRISALKTNHILLVIPRRALLFRNSINLKVLRKKSEELGKELVIFTNDEAGQQMIVDAGLKLYEGRFHERKKTITARLEKLPPKVIKMKEQRKRTLTEIAEQTRKKIPWKQFSTPQKLEQQKQRRYWMTSFFFNTVRKKTIIAYTGIVMLFFILVFSIAVPSATIYLTPESNVLENTVNIMFADPKTHPNLFRNPISHIIPTATFEMDFESATVSQSTGKIFTGTSSQCLIKIINQRTSKWTLIPKTRFTDATEVIFRSQTDLEIPAARNRVVTDAKGNPRQEKISGSIITKVEADTLDEHQRIIGARGNLPKGTKLILPGLSFANQSMLFAVTEETCTGGVTSFYTVVTEEDIKAAKKKITDEMEKKAKKILLATVDAENISKSLSLRLFDQPEAIQTKVLSLTVPQGIEGKKMDEFTIQGRMNVKGIAYEQQDYEDILEENLLAKVHPNKVLVNIDYDSSTSTIVYTDSDLHNLSKIKLSVTVRGIEEYNFDTKTEKGKEIVERILEYVPGKTASEANYFIANLEEIQQSHISIWPFWKTTLPERKGALHIKVE